MLHYNYALEEHMSLKHSNHNQYMGTMQGRAFVHSNIRNRLYMDNRFLLYKMTTVWAGQPKQYTLPTLFRRNF